MRQRQNNLRSRPVLKFLGAAVIASLSGACSSDILRFSDSPFANPFNGRADTATTGSINAPVQKVRASSLGMTSAASTYQPFPSAVAPSPTSQAALTQVAAAGNQPVLGSVAGWTATGGTPVTTGSGDTIEALSGRYGVPVQALRQINGIKGQPSAGQQIIIPAYNPGASGRAATAAAPAPSRTVTTSSTATSSAPRYESLSAPAKAAAPVAAAAPRTPRYESLGETPAKARAAAPKAAQKTVATADDDDDEPVATQQLKQPAAKTAPKMAAVPVPPKKMAQAEPVKSADKTKALAKANPKATGKTVQPKAADDDEDEAPAKTGPVKSAKSEPAKAPAKADVETTASIGNEAQEFRWPARGRVISGYGAKGPNGTNDGINIAVPEGTPVKAAEGGTVAYAGEEIKGYGKMVLIRHPNGYVSAYAHNGDLNVKRGDPVKRGQTIARSGQSGNVTSPQLHFELRKGSEPVDPSKFLEGH